MQYSGNSVAEQFNDIEKVLDSILNQKGWTPNCCQIILGVDINTNLDGETYRDEIGIKTKS